jgi:hypothetical protein
MIEWVNELLSERMMEQLVDGSNFWISWVSELAIVIHSIWKLSIATNYCD